MGPFDDTLDNVQTVKIEKYYPSYYGGGKRTRKPYKYRVILGLYDSTHGLLGGAYFYNNPDEMPAQDYVNAHGQIHIAYPASDYAAILDLLRNESPCYIRYVPSWKMASIKTALEPVGEGETT